MTGGTGRVGRVVVEDLLRRGIDVVAASRSITESSADDVAAVTHQAISADEVSAGGLTRARFDWSDRASHESVVTGLRQVYVAAPFSVSVEDVAHLVQQAVSAGVERLVMLSALGVENTPQLPLLGIEETVQAAGVPWVILRANWFMQNFTHPPLATWISGHGELRGCVTSDTRVAAIDSRDVAAVAAAVLADLSLTGTLDVCGAEALSMVEIAASLGRAAGRPVRYADLGQVGMATALAGEGIPPPVVPILVSLFAQVATPGSAEPSDVVERLTGRPAVTVNEFAEQNRTFWPAVAH